jgi:hypothetical protein
MDLTQINGNEYRRGHFLPSIVVGDNAPPGREGHAMHGAILGGVIRALSSVQNIDGVEMPSEKAVLAEIGILGARVRRVSVRKTNLQRAPALSAGIEVGRAYGEVEGYQSRPFGCEVGSQFHQRHGSRSPPIMPYGRISQVRFEASAFRS